MTDISEMFNLKKIAQNKKLSVAERFELSFMPVPMSGCWIWFTIKNW